MTEKLGAKEWKIKELIFNDLVTELTFQFETRKDCFALHISGANLEFGNRTLLFKEGECVGSGTHTAQCPPATWIKEVETQP